MARIAALFAAFTASDNEAQTEQELMRPVLAALGHTFEVQPALRTPDGTKKPDYVLYRDRAAIDAAKNATLDDTVAARGALAVADAKYWDPLTAILVSAYEEDLRARLSAGVWPVDMRVPARIEGAWQAVPFFDDEQWAEHARRFGLPVVGHDSIDIPEDIGRGVLLRGDGGLGLFLLLGGLVNRALGLPGEVHALGLVRALSRGERDRR